MADLPIPPVPEEYDPVWLAALLQEWQVNLQELELRYFICVPQHNEPDFLVDGLVVIADGTDWDPGSGQGLYRYQESTTAWVKIG